MMKHGLLAFGLGLATCVLPAARNACFAQESAPSTPRANQPNAPQNFAVHDLTATAASDPMTGWSEPRGLETPAPVTVSHGRYAASAIALPAQMMPARVARPDEFVVDDNLSATVRHVADEASQLTTEGLKLAGKGAVFSARARFIGAFQLVADARDTKNQTQFHSRALAAGLAALREADDFSHPVGPTAADCDPVAMAAGHTTPLIKDAQPNAVTRLQALQLYYSYATQQISAAVAGVPEASMALYYLGRIQPYLGESVDRPAVLADPKAMAIEQAAVLVDAQNYRAANELGVLLCGCGQLEAARKALAYSASICRRPEVLQNLAIVYKRLGDEPGAASMIALAKQQQGRTVPVASDAAAPKPLIYLVDHKTFDSDGPSPSAGSPVPPAPQSPASNQLRYRRADRLHAATGRTVDAGPVRAGATPHLGYLRAGRIHRTGANAAGARILLRVDDQIGFVFRVNGKPTTTPYRLNVGDTIRIGSLTMPTIQIDTPVQPDGTILLPKLGPSSRRARAWKLCGPSWTNDSRSFSKSPRLPLCPSRSIETWRNCGRQSPTRAASSPGKLSTRKFRPTELSNFRRSARFPRKALLWANCEARSKRVTRKWSRASRSTPVLTDRAPRSVYVLGEVQKPGKFALDAPTTVIQAISMAGSWNIGANLREVVVFRRDSEWRLMATRVNVRPALYNSRGLCADDIWLRDSDIVIVTKCPLQVMDDYINLIFTRGIYGVFPFTATFGIFKDISSAAAVTAI